MRYNQIRSLDISNGVGCRVSIFTQGCPIKCEGCFNSKLWNPDEGKEFTSETLNALLKLLNKSYINGLSILGGEPTIWTKDIVMICKCIKDTLPNKTIWLYSGYTLQHILNDSTKRDILEYIDVLVDGPYIESLKDLSLKFRGSSNQKIWDIKKSLECKEWIEYDYN